MFEGQPDSPAHTLAGLAQLLAFAEAVGTREVLLAAIDAQISAAAPLVAEVQMGEQQLQLPADSCYYFDCVKPLQLWCCSAGTGTKVSTAGSAAERESMRQQFVQQVEALLYLAYKLQLRHLQQVSRRCIANNSCFRGSLLSSGDYLRSVMSRRVVDAAAGCGAGQAALMVSSSTELCAILEDQLTARRQLLKPLDLTAAQMESLNFKAEVQEDFNGFTRGQIVHVELDLFNCSQIYIRKDANVSRGDWLDAFWSAAASVGSVRAAPYPRAAPYQRIRGAEALSCLQPPAAGGRGWVCLGLLGLQCRRLTVGQGARLHLRIAGSPSCRELALLFDWRCFRSPPVSDVGGASPLHCLISWQT
jgi:hypothetical protein